MKRLSRKRVTPTGFPFCPARITITAPTSGNSVPGPGKVCAPSMIRPVEAIMMRPSQPKI